MGHKGQKRKAPKKRGGFTLLELAVALAAALIVSGIAAAALSDRGSSRRELLAAAETLASDIRHARQVALISGRRVAVFFDWQGGSYHIYYQSPYAAIRTARLPSGVDMSTAPGRDVLGFLPRGTPSEGFSVGLSNRRHSVTLSVVGSGGRVRISETREDN